MLSRPPYVHFVAKQAWQRVGPLFRSERYLTAETIVYLDEATSGPCMEYCSHTWGGAPQTSFFPCTARLWNSLSADGFPIFMYLSAELTGFCSH